MCKIYYVTGTTCAGKDTFMDRVRDKFPNIVGCVNVGKEFRRRHPPEYFQGLGAMPHTEKEALAIFEELLAEQKDKKYVFVSGQPRLTSQIEFTIDKYPGTIIWMYASDEELKRRLDNRFKDDKSSYELSEKRLINDKVQMFSVYFELLRRKHPIITFDTEHEGLDSFIYDLIY